MGTKNHPGLFDCYADAEPDEPMFVLLARDLLAPPLVALWAALRDGDDARATKCVEAAHAAARRQRPGDEDKISEANACARAMEAWRRRRLAPGGGRADG